MSDSSFSGAVIERTVAGQATLRNARTIRRITARYL